MSRSGVYDTELSLSQAKRAAIRILDESMYFALDQFYIDDDPKLVVELKAVRAKIKTNKVTNKQQIAAIVKKSTTLSEDSDYIESLIGFLESYQLKPKIKKAKTTTEVLKLLMAHNYIDKKDGVDILEETFDDIKEGKRKEGKSIEDYESGWEDYSSGW